ncbi:hypothetical protein PSA5_18495 [Pseudomonas syringae pv. actinidiae]|nr:hypothetical protein PSA5_18495 [Pseudomonas syringae pv. actinidiae]
MFAIEQQILHPIRILVILFEFEEALVIEINHLSVLERLIGRGARPAQTLRPVAAQNNIADLI